MCTDRLDPRKRHVGDDHSDALHHKLATTSTRSACTIIYSFLEHPTVRDMASVLFIGVSAQDPNIDLPPKVTAQALDTAINQSVEDLKNAGYQVVLFLPPIMDGINELEKELQKNKYELVLVGVSTFPIQSTRKSGKGEHMLTCDCCSLAYESCQSIRRTSRAL